MGINKPMNKLAAQVFSALLILLLPSGAGWALDKTLGVIQPGEYPVVLVSNHLPETFKNSEAYWESLQKVELETGGPYSFRDLPKLGMKQPFMGAISLGDEPRKFGVIVDLWGEEKRLYVDTDGDGSFQNEPWRPLLNQWYGLRIYWVESPEPVELRVPYKDRPGQSFPLQILVSGMLNKPGPFFKEKPYLRVLVRSWFLGKIIEDGAGKYLAIVDRNNNGRFNDPEDGLYLDYNDDSFFADEELILRKSEVKLKGKSPDARAPASFTVSWGVYPDKVVIGGK
ncbi:MAG: hypothetical protein K6U80_12355 [Firmicutes bacterium]|nr:hypothetical protein [Bacillota bacterium]